ncbi:MAG: DUF2946 domain-containing protein [Geobacter sp.]|nr:DUF2946 domain-containing protein [Geobacter sp.]
MNKRLSLLFVIIFLLSTLVESLHFHDDGNDHSDCPVCVAAHNQQSDSACTPPALHVPLEVAETPYSRPIPAVVTKLFFTPANNRAPPA